MVSTVDLVLQNKFRFDRKLDMEHCSKIVINTELNWNLIPFDDAEWNYVLNRMEFCLDLIDEYKLTKQDVYIKKAKQLIFDYISKMCNVNNFTSRTLDTGIRLIVWDQCIEELIKAQWLSTSEIEQINEAIKFQMIKLVDNYENFQGLNNWGLTQSVGFLNCLKYVKIENEYIEFYADMFKQHLEIEFFPDGMQWEQSSVYHVEVIQRLLQLTNADYINNKYIDILKKALVALIAITDFKHNTILLGDGDLIDTSELVDKLLKTLKYDNFEEFVKENISDDINKIALDLENACFSMVKDKQNYISIQNGTIGYGHGHFDNLHVNLDFGGSKVLVDSGRYTYVETNKYRKQLKSFSAHNGPYIENSSLNYVSSWENKGFIETFPIKTFFQDEVNYFETAYMPTTNNICTRCLVHISNKFTIITDYANADYNINLKFFENFDFNVKNQSYLADKFKVNIFGSPKISEELQNISCKYNSLKEVSALHIKQDGYKKVQTIITAPKIQVEEYTDFEYFHKDRLKNGENTYKMYKVKTATDTYIYGDNTYICGNCNNAIVVANKLIMANRFIYNLSKDKLIILKS